MLVQDMVGATTLLERNTRNVSNKGCKNGLDMETIVFKDF